MADAAARHDSCRATTTKERATRERGGELVLAIPAGASDKVAPYGEFGYRFNLHDAPMSLVHLAKTTLNPRLSAEAAFRVDSRFRATGSLADFNRPALRWVVRLMLDGINIVDRLSGKEKNKRFVATFGFEYEGGFRSGIPAGFQVIIRGDIDLLKALKGNQADTP